MFRLEEIAKATDGKVLQKSHRNYFKNVSTDSRTIQNDDIFFALTGQNFDGHDFIQEAIKKGAKAIVISKKTKNKCYKVNIIKVKDTAVALGKLARYHRKKYKMPLIAITGSAGKTTTKDIVYDVLKTKYKALKNFGTHNNQIGVPQTIFKVNQRHEICVLELGTNHFGEISYLSSIALPQIAVITNIGASHLEFLKNLNGVLKEKSDIFNYLRGPKIALLNGDDKYLRRIKLPREFKVFTFGLKANCDFRASDIHIEDNKVSFLFNKKHKLCLNTSGKFNIYNALIGVSCGLIFGIDIKNIRATLNNFQFAQRRLNRIDCENFSVIDDTYNSNPLSLMGAIETLLEFKNKGRKILIMGDMLELGPCSLKLHRQIGRFISKKPIDILITLGHFSKATANEAKLNSTKSLRKIFSFDSKAELIDFLRSKVKSGDLLLIKGSRLLQMEEITNSLTKMERLSNVI